MSANSTTRGVGTTLKSVEFSEEMPISSGIETLNKTLYLPSSNDLLGIVVKSLVENVLSGKSIGVYVEKSSEYYKDKTTHCLFAVE